MRKQTRRDVTVYRIDKSESSVESSELEIEIWTSSAYGWYLKP